MVDGFLKSLEFNCESKAAQIISCAQKSSISSIVSANAINTFLPFIPPSPLVF
jgi:hypothetical protein